MRRRRWLKLLAIPVVLAIVLTVAFWALLYNPFERDVVSLDGMVPMKFGDREISYVIRAPGLREITDRKQISDTIRQSPAWKGVEEDFGLDRYLFDQIQQIEKQVQTAVGGWSTSR
jgi:hypothetical protein